MQSDSLTDVNPAMICLAASPSQCIERQEAELSLSKSEHNRGLIIGV